jgi:hypothetical protein
LFELFDRQQILLLSFHELRNDPDTLMNRVKLFLGLNYSESFSFRHDNSLSFPSKLRYPLCTDQDKLTNVFEPYLKELYELLIMTPGPPSEEYPFPRFRTGNCTA